jgi:ribosome biogenesis protein NSA1
MEGRVDTGISDTFNSVIYNDASTSSRSIISIGTGGDVAITDAECGFDYNAKNPVTFSVDAPVSASDTCVGSLAFGGKENDVKIYDINTQSIVWKAKNVPYDKLGLRVPIWITALKFFDSSLSSVSTGAHFVTGTGFKQVRVYDTTAGIQPVASMEIGEYRVADIAVHDASANQIYISDVSGCMSLWDVRMQRRLFALKGATGAVRHLSLDRDNTFLGSVGLDRILRTHNARTHKLTSTTYLKNRLTRCLVYNKDGGNGKGSTDSVDDEDEGDENDDDIVDEFVDSDDEDEDDDAEGIHDDDDGADGGDEIVFTHDDDDEDSENESPQRGQKKWTSTKSNKGAKKGEGNKRKHGSKGEKGSKKRR